jgi:hypothetical protein
MCRPFRNNNNKKINNNKKKTLINVVYDGSKILYYIEANSNNLCSFCKSIVKKINKQKNKNKIIFHSCHILQ